MFVVVGSSAAAIGCIKGIRRADAAAPITMVTDEPLYSYARPQLAAFLAGTLTRAELLAYCDVSFYAANGVVVRAGTQALGIDAKAGLLQLGGGETPAYDKLLVATGSRPFVPQIKGIEAVQNRFTFCSLADATALSAAVTPESRVLVLGAGHTALACAEGLCTRCAAVTVVGFAPQVAAENAPGEEQQRLQDMGVRFFRHAAVASFSGNVAKLQNGKKLPFDVLVTAVGTRPNTQLVAAAGGAVGRGILVDGTGATTLPGVYAAGSCAQQPGPAGEAPAFLPWHVAMAQGEAAGLAMAGGEQAPAVPPKAQPRVQALRAQAIHRKGDTPQGAK